MPECKYDRTTSCRIPGLDSDDRRSRLFEGIMPAQFYLASVPDYGFICATESSLDSCRELETKVSSGKDPGDPWSNVDNFDKQKVSFHKVL